MAEPDLAGTVSWRELLTETTSRLDSGDDARRLIEEASGHEAAELHLSLDQPATVRGVARLDSMVARRLAGEPLQYVLGRWGFRTLDLAIDARVLIPRPETEVVAGVALDELKRAELPGRQLLAVDLGTGSGAIGFSLAVENLNSRVVCTDRSAAALTVARANLAGLGRPATRVQLYEGSWYEALPAELAGEIDVVVSNPPYIGADEELPVQVIDFEPAEALLAGPTGLEAAAHIIGQAPLWLRSGGSLVLELAPAQMTAASDLARAGGFVEVFVMPDLAGRDRVLVAR